MASLTINPNPLTQGGTGTISGGTPGDTVTLDFDPPPSTTVTLDANGKATFPVPANARSLIATDTAGNEAAATVTQSGRRRRR